MEVFFELQEVVLHRPKGGEKLGLTLCYETDAEDGLTDIFIDDIHPEGLAAIDGRLKLGDQIIQINGEDIKTKPQAQDIFIQSKGDISLLVARPPTHYHSSFNLEEEGFVDEDDEILELANMGNDDHNECEEALENLGIEVGAKEVSFVDREILTSSTPHHQSIQKQSGSNRSSLASGDSGAILNQNATKESSSSTSECYIGTSSTSSGQQKVVATPTESPKDVSMKGKSDLLNTTKSSSNFSTGSNSFSSTSTNNSKCSNNYDGYAVGDDEFCFIMNNANEKSLQAAADKELSYVNKKLQDIKVECDNFSAKHNMMMSSSLCYAEPIYETIPEMSENDEQVYSLPLDTVNSAPKITPKILKSNKVVHLQNSSQVKKSPNKDSKLIKLGFPLNKLIRSTSMGNKAEKAQQKQSGATEEVDENGERTEKIKEVEQWLKSSLCEHSLTPLLSPPSKFRQKKQGSQEATPNASNSVKHSASLNFPKTGNMIPALPQVQRRVVQQPKGKMPLKGTMPRPTSFHCEDSRSNRKSPEKMIMYTDLQNLESTMKIQQEMLRRSLSNDRKSPASKPTLQDQYRLQQEQAALMQKQTGQSRPGPPVFHAPPPPSESNYCVPQEEDNGQALTTFKTETSPTKPVVPAIATSSNEQWEWKVKIRKDGTRYVTRRPASRSKFLKDRAQRLAEERNSGMTTDDDAMSELKASCF